MTDKLKLSISFGTSTETTQDHTSALKLWRAVIAQAMVDASSGHKHDRLPVTRWLLHDDFEVVCGLAQLEPQPIRKILAELLHEHPIRAQVMSKVLVQQIESL